MTTPASDLMLANVPILHTPALDDALAEYQGRFGLQLVQHIPKVLAVLRLKSLTVQLWAWHADAPAFRPGCQRVAVHNIFALHARLRQSAPGALSGSPRLKPWGAWEFSLCDLHGNVLQLVQWTMQPAAAGAGQAAAPRIRASR